nr:hypothetical protein [Tanacetum cinerariifolium]
PSPVLSPAPPPSPIRSLGYRAAMIRLRDKAASTSSPPSQLPSASRREDRPERERLVMRSLIHGMRLCRLCRVHQLAPIRSWADT